MQAEIHPEYSETVIQCTCGNVIQTRSTRPNMHIGICSACHPFFTGEQRFVDTAGRVDKFSKRYGDDGGKRRKKPKLSDLAPKVEAPVEDEELAADGEAPAENIAPAEDTAPAEAKAPAEAAS